MISKEQAAGVLREEGYNIEVANSVVTLVLSGDELEGYTENFEKRLRDMGYDQSFGWRGAK